jgi:hypothetical protein
MRGLLILGVLFFGLWVGTGNAEDSVQKAAAAQGVGQDAPSNSEMKEIDTGSGSNEAVSEEDYGVDQPGLMPEGEVYDENTGMPNVVPSDTEGELE